MKNTSANMANVADSLKTSGNITEVAEPLKFNLQLFAEGEGELVSETGGGGESVETPERNYEKDSAYAEIRREKEAAEKRAADIEAKQKEHAEWFKKRYGDDFGVEDVDGFISKMAQQTANEKFINLSERAAAGEDVTSGLDELIKEHPTFKELASKLEGYEKINEQVALENMQKEELGKFNKEFGFELKSYEDISELPNANEILDLMSKKGLELTDAYYLANREDITKSGLEKVKQETINKMAGKNHIAPTANPEGTGSINTPMSPETLDEYRKIFTDKRGKPHPDSFYKELYTLSTSGKNYSMKALKVKHGIK